MARRHAPGEIRDAIVRFLEQRPEGATVAEIRASVDRDLGGIAASSVRSYLRLNVGKRFERIAPATYTLIEGPP